MRDTKSRRLSPADRLYAINICHAVETYAGGVKFLNAKLGISHDKKRKWSEPKILDGFRVLHSKYGLTPNVWDYGRRQNLREKTGGHGTGVFREN
jgi:hypothetical protein